MHPPSGGLLRKCLAVETAPDRQWWESAARAAGSKQGSTEPPHPKAVRLARIRSGRNAKRSFCARCNT